jgi:hypothetical protein
MPDWSRNSTQRLLYLTLCVIVVASRIAYVAYDRTYTNVSGAEVERAAASVARDGSIANIYSDHSGPSAHVVPLYPLLLGAVYWLFGWNTQTGRVVQELLSIAATTAGIAILPTVARATGLSVIAGWGAAVALAVLPLNLWIESSGSWEQPYAALLLLVSVILFCRLIDERWVKRDTVVACGIVMGIAALLSPAVLPGLGLMALVAFLQNRRAHQILLSVALLLSTAALVISPWVIRNYLVFDSFVPMRSNMGLELAIGNHDGANGKTFGTSFDDPGSPMYRMHPFTSRVERLRLEQMGEPAYMREQRRKALGWIAAHRAGFALLTAQRIRLFWLPPRSLWSPASPGASFKAAVAVSTALLAFAGLVWMVVRRQRYAWILVSAVIGPSVLYVITHVDPRHRYVVFGLTTLVAADTFHRLSGVVLSGRFKQADASGA